MGKVMGVASATHIKNFEDPCSGHQLKRCNNAYRVQVVQFLHEWSVPLKTR